VPDAKAGVPAIAATAIGRYNAGPIVDLKGADGR
jgi:hypothetical protein